MLFRISVLFAAFLPFVSVAVAVTPDQQNARATVVEKEIRALNDREVQGFLQHDVAALDRIWSDDFVVTNPLNELATKKQVIELMRTGVLVMKAYTRRIEYVRVYDGVVIVAGSEDVTWGGKMPIAGRPHVLRFTGIWMNQNGHWREVARHANVVPPRPARLTEKQK